MKRTADDSDPGASIQTIAAQRTQAQFLGAPSIFSSKSLLTGSGIDDRLMQLNAARATFFHISLESALESALDSNLDFS
jgi:hypothetical protein